MHRDSSLGVYSRKVFVFILIAISALPVLSQSSEPQVIPVRTENRDMVLHDMNSTLVFDVGQICLGDSVRINFQVFNKIPGGRSLRIAEVKTSCGCLAATTLDRLLPHYSKKEGYGNLAVIVKPKSKGDYKSVLTLYFEGFQENPISIEVTGLAMTRYSLAPSVLEPNDQSRDFSRIVTDNFPSRHTQDPSLKAAGLTVGSVVPLDAEKSKFEVKFGLEDLELLSRRENRLPIYIGGDGLWEGAELIFNRSDLIDVRPEVLLVNSDQDGYGHGKMVVSLPASDKEMRKLEFKGKIFHKQKGEVCVVDVHSDRTVKNHYFLTIRISEANANKMRKMADELFLSLTCGGDDRLAASVPIVFSL